MTQVKFHRVTASNLDNLAIDDGNIIFVTDTGQLYLDIGNSRVNIRKYGLNYDAETNKVSLIGNGENEDLTLPLATLEAAGLMSKDDKKSLDKANEEIDEINEMLFTHTTAESVNQEVSLNGNPNLEMNVTELDGRAKQESTNGYNLLPSSVAKSGTSNGVTFSTDGNGKYTISGKLTNAENARLDFPISKTYSAGTYYWHLRNSGTTSGNINISIRSNTASIAYLSLNETNRINSFTLSESVTIDNIRLTVGSGYGTSDSIDITFEPTIELTGDTTDFEKYTNGASPNPDYKQDIHVVTGTQDVVVSGKNLFLGSNEETNNFTATYNNETLTIVAKRDTTGNNVFHKVILNQDLLKNGETYVISSTNVSGVVQSLKLQLRNKNGTSAGKSMETSVVYDNNYDLYVVGNVFGAASTTQVTEGQTAVIKDIQVEQNTQATIYEPYITPITKQVHLGDIELAKIGTYKDKIYPSGGKWYLHKEIKKVIYNGEEDWTLNSSLSNANRTVFFTGKPSDFYNYTDISSNILALSNKFIATSQSATWKPYEIGYTKNTASRINFIVAPNTTMESFVTIINGTTFYYAIDNATDTEITGTLKEELDALQKLQQLNGKTIVSIDGNLGADFKLVYENDSISDLNTRVGNIESNYVKKTDYATDSTGGVVKVSPQYKGTNITSGGALEASTKTYEQYTSADNSMFVGKGTLENVITGKDLTTKAYVDGLIGDINTMLDQMNREVI